jgi:hypothetical protein
LGVFFPLSGGLRGDRTLQKDFFSTKMPPPSIKRLFSYKTQKHFAEKGINYFKNVIFEPNLEIDYHLKTYSPTLRALDF